MTYGKWKWALIAGLLSLAPGIGSAQPRCSVLEGNYAFTFSGTLPGPGGVLAPFGGVGIQVFTAAGTFTAKESAFFPGAVVRDGVFSGTYTLNPDCSGTMTAKFLDGTSAMQDFVLTNGGRTIYAVGVGAAAPGQSLSTTFTKLTPPQ